MQTLKRWKTKKGLTDGFIYQVLGKVEDGTDLTELTFAELPVSKKFNGRTMFSCEQFIWDFYAYKKQMMLCK